MNRLTVIIVLIMSLFMGQAQAQTQSGELLEKASSYLKDQGFQVFPDGDGVAATTDNLEISVYVFSDPTLPLPLLRMTACVATYENTTDLNVLSFVNSININSPVIKFSATGTQKGDYALVNGGNPEDVIYMVYATIDQYYSSDDAMKKIIYVYSKSLKEIKKGMPASLKQ